jgi:DNA-binding transcriptional LysR family regulator
MTPLNWELCRTFLAVVREGSLSRAARALELTQPTVGRHIEEIEKTLGISLFTRSPQGLTPTGAALDLKPHAEAMAEAADAFVRAASGGSADERGTVRVTVSELVATEVMPAILVDFHAKHPAIAIELAVTNATENLLQRAADVAVRLVRPTQGALHARKLGKLRFGFYAHRDYIMRRGAPRSLAELRKHTLIGFDKGAASIQALRGERSSINRDDLALRCDNAVAQLAMARAGFGIGRGADLIARLDPDVVPVLPEAYGVDAEIWVVMHEDARGVRRTRLMFDHLVSSLEKLIRGAGEKPRKAKIG